MHSVLEAKLKLPPQQLFKKGACHIFAKELVRAIPNLGLKVRRAGRTFPGDQTHRNQGMHVYAHKDGVMFDVMGTDDEKTYLKANHWDYCDVSELELFEELEMAEKGPLNRWGHYLDKDFQREAIAKAADFIDANKHLWL